MESVDVRVLRAARDWHAAGHRLMLATVVKTWGSSPRPPGSMMALREDGRCIGSVSGGCIEDDLIHMLLIGAGALAEYVATMALFNDFAVTLCDPRVGHRDTWAVAGVHITTEMPDDAVRIFAPDARSCIVALSHDPKLDDMALLEALHSPAFYVGAIGSRRNANSRTQRFIEHFDETEASVQRLHSPVGLYIGSKTPAEIAVSVMAEIIAVKNGVVPARRLHAELIGVDA